MTLSTYILTFILTTSPARAHAAEGKEAYETRAATIADDIVAVVSEETEPAVFPQDDDRHKTATLIATLAFWESNFQLYVDNGSCDDRAWRKTREGRATLLSGDCDGGWAYSMFQIHPEGGIALEPGGGWHHEFGAIDGQAMLADRKVAVRVALHMARQSIGHGAGLCQYSGEIGPCPKAAARLSFAQRWWAAHPYQP